jgi:hypothetical protein
MLNPFLLSQAGWPAKEDFFRDAEPAEWFSPGEADH